MKRNLWSAVLALVLCLGLAGTAPARPSPLTPAQATPPDKTAESTRPGQYASERVLRLQGPISPSARSATVHSSRPEQASGNTGDFVTKNCVQIFANAV